MPGFPLQRDLAQFSSVHKKNRDRLPMSKTTEKLNSLIISPLCDRAMSGAMAIAGPMSKDGHTSHISVLCYSIENISTDAITPARIRPTLKNVKIHHPGRVDKGVITIRPSLVNSC